MNLSVRQLKVWGEKLRRVWYLTSRSNLDLIAAGVAFYAAFAIFPGMAALISLFGLVADPAVVRAELEVMAEVIPADAYVLIADQVDRLLMAGRQTLGWTTVVSFVLALWSARAGVGGLVQGLNAIYDIPNRGGLWHTAFSLILTLALITMAILALLIVFVAPILIAYLPLSRDWEGFLSLLRWASALVLMTAGLWLIYRVGPNRRMRRGVFLTWGAVAVIGLWLGASAALSLYMSNFPSYNEIYGSIGAVVALLLWLYVSAYLVLLGAALNAVREAHDRPPRPLLVPARPEKDAI